MDEEFKHGILSCIEESMKAEGFTEMTIDLTGTNSKGEGYMADFIFATVTGKDVNKKSKEVHLALKVGKRSEQLRESMPVIVEYYRREMFFYDKLLPTFSEFQLEKNIMNPFDAVPKCYKTIFRDNLEALILENLKKRGFALHDKTQPMNLPHIHLVLKNYAKLHALSFALKDQKRKKFDELAATYNSLLGQFVVNMGFTEKDNKVVTDLREAGRDDLAAQLEHLTRRGKETVLLEILNIVPEETVIIHGDCHNNNFLFEYQDVEKENPVSVAIIDWQVSEVNSPVMDLSYFIYCTASKESLAQLDVLLGFYHSHLTDFLRDLGSDAEKLFPYSKLVEHWKIYSTFPFIMTTVFLRIYYVADDFAPSLDEFGENRSIEGIVNGINLPQKDAYRDRLISLVDHYFSFKLT